MIEFHLYQLLKVWLIFWIQNGKILNKITYRPICSEFSDDPSLEQINLTVWVKQAFDQSKGSAGARTLSVIVSKQHNVKITRYKAEKIMAQQGLVSRQLIRHRYSKADKEQAIHDNLLKRAFSPTKCGRAM